MKRSRTMPSARRLALEHLDPRDLPAGISLASGVLTIAGSAFDDRGTVALKNVGTPTLPIFKVVANLEHRVSPTDPWIQDDSKSYFFTNVSRIVFQGEGGDDQFTNTTSYKSTAFGGPGNDTLQGGKQADVLTGGNGDDSLLGGRGNDILYGDQGFSIGGGGPVTPGNDVLYGGDGDDWVDGQGADDLLDGGKGNDKLWGTTGKDMLVGREGSDRLSAGDGDDFLYGDHGFSIGGPVATPQGNDTLDGGDGDDWLDGQGADDLLDGGEGNDKLWGTTGQDKLYGRAGDDKLFGGDGPDLLNGEAGHDTLEGAAGNDTLSGGDGDDRLEGGVGNDRLGGGDGTDILVGGTGNDRLDGGKDGSADVLTGGAGNDTFVPDWFSPPGGWKNRDRPQDFHDTATEKDRFVVGTDWPVGINFVSIRCLEETDEVGVDEPYVVFWVGNVKNPTASYATRTAVFDGDQSMEEGDTRTQSKTVWGPAPIANPNDLVILAAVVENDSSNPDSVTSTVESVMLPGLLGALGANPPKTRAQMVAGLKTDMYGGLGLGAASGGINQDEYSHPKELTLTADLLDQARHGVAPGKALMFSFDDGQYLIRFKFTRATGLE